MGIDLGLEGAELGALFLFILDADILNESVYIFNQLAEAFLQDHQFLFIGNMQSGQVAGSGVADFGDGRGKADERAAQLSGDQVDDREDDQGDSGKNQAVGCEQRSDVGEDIAVWRQKQELDAVLRLPVIRQIDGAVRLQGKFFLPVQAEGVPGAVVYAGGNLRAAPVQNLPVLIQNRITASRRDQAAGKHIFNLAAGHADHHDRRSVGIIGADIIGIGDLSGDADFIGCLIEKDVNVVFHRFLIPVLLPDPGIGKNGIGSHIGIVVEGIGLKGIRDGKQIGEKQGISVVIGAVYHLMGGIMGKLILNGEPCPDGIHGVLSVLAEIFPERLVADELNGRLVNGLQKIIRHPPVQLHVGPLVDHGFLKDGVVEIKIYGRIGKKQHGQHGRRGDEEDFFPNSHECLPV